MEEIITEKEVSNKPKRLSLKPVQGKDGLFEGIKSDGKRYTVRADRHRYFRPNEWLRFLSCIKEDRIILFETLLQTGGRIEEILNLKPKDFIWEENSVRLSY